MVPLLCSRARLPVPAPTMLLSPPTPPPLMPPELEVRPPLVRKLLESWKLPPVSASLMPPKGRRQAGTRALV